MRTFAIVAALILASGCSEADAPGATSGGGGTGAASATAVGGAASSVGGAGAGGTGGAGGSGGDACMNTLPPSEDVPDALSATGLYEDAVMAFAPQFELWSDDAAKQRWVYLPECDVIDTSDPADWQLPVGTRLWKEFSVGGTRIETRLIQRTGPGAHDFAFAAYVWDAAQNEALRTPAGVVDAAGTSHDVPSEDDCRRCHGSHAKRGGRPSRALGFSALQLSHDDILSTLPLSDPVAVTEVPSDGVARAALGVLHANCGHCHNDSIDGVPQVSLNLWLTGSEASLETTAAYRTAVGQPNELFNDQHVSARIVPGDPAASSVHFRMGERGNNAQMPPLGSEQVDDVGRAEVQAWIEAL